MTLLRYYRESILAEVLEIKYSSQRLRNVDSLCYKWHHDFFIIA